MASIQGLEMSLVLQQSYPSCRLEEGKIEGQFFPLPLPLKSPPRRSLISHWRECSHMATPPELPCPSHGSRPRPDWLPRPHPCSASSPFLSYFPLTHSEVLFFFFSKSQYWIPVSGSVSRETNLTLETIQLVLLSFKPPAAHLFCYAVPYILSLLLW